MSVDFKLKEEGVAVGTIKVSSANYLTPEEYTYRLSGLIRLIKAQDEDMADWDSIRSTLEILEEMMPTPAQAERMFLSEH